MQLFSSDLQSVADRRRKTSGAHVEWDITGRYKKPLTRCGIGLYTERYQSGEPMGRRPMKQSIT
jgi:hypothetical protein